MALVFFQGHSLRATSKICCCFCRTPWTARLRGRRCVSWTRRVVTAARCITCCTASSWRTGPGARSSYSPPGGATIRAAGRRSSGRSPTPAPTATGSRHSPGRVCKTYMSYPVAAPEILERGWGQKNMKYKPPHMAAVFFMTIFYRLGGGAWPYRPQPRICYCILQHISWTGPPPHGLVCYHTLNFIICLIGK